MALARSAWHYGTAAGHAWPRHLKKLVFLGTPHHGAPLERAGNWVDILLGATPYAAPFARLGKMRSAGITDLRHGNLLDEDWVGRDRFARSGDRRHDRPVDRLDLVAAGTDSATNLPHVKRNLLGDDLVSVTRRGVSDDADATQLFPDHDVRRADGADIAVGRILQD